jgi:hypothetical protein
MSFQIDQQVQTCDFVNLRSAPGHLGNPPPAVLAVLPEGTLCTVTGSVQLADGLAWWPVRVTLANGQLCSGWAAERVGKFQLLASRPAPVPPVQPPPVQPPPLPPLPGAGHVARANRLGFYLHNTNNDAGLWDAISQVQPPTILIHHDAFNDMLLAEIRSRRSPDSFIVGRWYVENNQQTAMLEGGDPEGEGRRLAERILTYDFEKFKRRTQSGRLFIDAWMSLNECLPGPASGSFRENPARFRTLYAAYDRFQVAFRDRLVAEGIEAVAFNFAAGNFSEAAHYLDYFPRTLATYTYLGFHEYGWPSLIPGSGTHTGAGLYRAVLRHARRSDGHRHQILITEAGLTRAYGTSFHDEGWLNPAQPLDENTYWASLAWYNTLLDQDDVLGACLYQVGHRGDWATFRHLGVDNAGRPLHLMGRIADLRSQSAARAALPAAVAAPAPLPPSARLLQLAGQVTLDGSAVAQVGVRLVGDLATLGAVRGAAIVAPGAVTWSRQVTGFSGTVRTAWDRFVAGHVAGLTWDDFRRLAPIVNPSLTAEKGRFAAEQLYLLPENAAAAPTFLWDRRVAGYRGTLYQCWLDLVQGKVLGFGFLSFRRQFLAYNPILARTAGRLTADQEYLLPRTVGIDLLSLSTTTNAAGRFRFASLPVGSYRVEVTDPQPFALPCTLVADTTLDLALPAL